MTAAPLPGPQTWCPSCGWWYVGEVKEKLYSEYDYEEGTPVDDIETYSLLVLPCGCTDEDIDDMDEVRTITNGWKCLECGTAMGDNFQAANMHHRARRKKVGKITVSNT